MLFFLVLRRLAYKGGWRVAALSLSLPLKLRSYIEEGGMSEGRRRDQYFSAIVSKAINSKILF